MTFDVLGFYDDEEVLLADFRHGEQPTTRDIYSTQMCAQTQKHSLFPHSYNPMGRLYILAITHNIKLSASLIHIHRA